MSIENVRVRFIRPKGFHDLEKWIEDDICTEKEQQLREYRNYTCGVGGCVYEITQSEWIDTSEVRNKQNGVSCDDSQFCTVSDYCSEGICVGDVKDCSGTNDQCNIGYCDEEQDACIPEAVPDQTPCNDGQFCTENDLCDAGLCVGTAISVDDEVSCTADSCDEQNDVIIHLPQNNVCDNGLWCDGAEYCDVTLDCQAGTAPVCSGEDDQCNTGICDEETDSCIPEPVQDGALCDDGLGCTENDICSAGICTAGPVMDCSINNIEGVNSCGFEDDGISTTYDSRTEFISLCIEPGQCTTGDDTISHVCDLTCGAECVLNSDCEPKTIGGVYYYDPICGGTCGCEYQNSCQDECQPGSDNICSVEGEYILECVTNYDSDPCYEYKPKEDCTDRNACQIIILEEPYCGQCQTNKCFNDCFNTQTLHGDWTCGDADCSYSVSQDFIDVDNDYVDDRCDDCIDLDFDGACDDVDTCVGVYNPTQVDSDGDGFGNACDTDRDNDGYPAHLDCNDWNKNVNPGMTEILKDGLDNDCNPETSDRPETLRGQDILLGVKILNEDTALVDRELMIAVYVKNRGTVDARDIKIRSTIRDDFISDAVTIPKLDSGATTRVMVYLSVDDIEPDMYYLRTALNVQTVKKARYSQVLLN